MPAFGYFITLAVLAVCVFLVSGLTGKRYHKLHYYILASLTYVPSVLFIIISLLVLFIVFVVPDQWSISPNSNVGRLAVVLMILIPLANFGYVAISLARRGNAAFARSELLGLYGALALAYAVIMAAPAFAMGL